MASDNSTIILAVIGSFTTLAGQIIAGIFWLRGRRKDEQDKKVLAQKVEDHSIALNDKLDANTRLTVLAANGADKAYTEANSFNQRLYRIEHELKSTIESELQRLSTNFHALRNALVPVVGEIPYEHRSNPEDPKET